MSDEYLIRCGSPTLAGLKTGNMFAYPYKSREEVKSDLRRLNKILVPWGLRILPLRYSDRTVLLYLYRVSSLEKDLSQKEAARILREVGYENAGSDRCIVELIGKLRGTNGFPHEIGLFLSYPPEDVRGFIDNHAENCKYIGFWKVYGDVDKAKKTFASYEKCTNRYNRMWRHGASLKSLIVECS